MSETVCSGFEPQTYLKERCKKCFRLRSKHELPANGEADNISVEPASISTTIILKDRNKDKRRLWKDKQIEDENGAPEQNNEEVDDETTTTSISYKSALSKGVTTAKSLESISSIPDSRSLVTAISESITEDERANTPTELDPEFLDASIMRNEIKLLKEEIIKLKEERQNWTIRREGKAHEGDQSFVDILEDRLAVAENCVQDYRDENTVLKCQLRELQENEDNLSRRDILEKLEANELRCEELMKENEAVRKEANDLQQEIEEMQDQYREEEIEEFRELQRELEQNSKNCRIMQFKLRKSERIREQLEAEKQRLDVKIKDLLMASTSSNDSLAGKNVRHSDAIRIKELESELRIAKEVSVRLHNELENTEDKRYKLEDEVFYLKEKVRELHTQTKWREARNRAEQQARRVNNEITLALNESELGKEMRDVLEREADLRDQLKFAEEDLKRTQMRLQDVENENEELLRKLSKMRSIKRPPMMRSISEGHTQVQLELAEHEVEQLSTKVERLEKKNVHLTKKLVELELGTQKLSLLNDSESLSQKETTFDISTEMQNDISKLMAKINDLERRNRELCLQLKTQNRSKSPSQLETVNTELRIEKEHKKILENELMELKRIMLQSENQKLISMAIKVEVLNNQLAFANERCNNLHRKIVNDNSGNSKYEDSLKQKCEELERQIGEQKASAMLKSLHGDSATAEEIEQCCEVLASVEAQTNRICKQIEKIDNAQKDERRRSLSKESSATIIAELASVISELNNVHRLLEAHKLNIARLSPSKDSSSRIEAKECSKCKETEGILQSQQDEISFYKKKNKDLTNQILQTEDRWTVEIEKQRQLFESEIRNLQKKLIDTEKSVEEYRHLFESKTIALNEKTKMLQERDEKCEKLKIELLDLKKEIQEIDADRKSAKEYEIKYKKLESLYDSEKEKNAQERGRLKSEMITLRKKSEDTLIDFEKLKNSYETKENLWIEDREHLENQLVILKKKTKMENEPLYATITNINERKYNKLNENNTNINEMKKELMSMERKVKQLSSQVESVNLTNEELRAELLKTQQNWQKNKEDLLHKARQDEKVRNVEMDVLQQKFISRMRIMEDTNKSLHSQLVQARRERDYHREALCTYEKKIADEQQRMEKNVKNYDDLIKKSTELSKKVEDFEMDLKQAKVDLKLAKEAHETDKVLWMIERSHLKAIDSRSEINDDANAKITESALKAAENVQKKYSEYHKFYTKEVNRLNAKIKELTNDSIAKQTDTDCKIKELKEQIKVLEISHRNLIEVRDMQAGTTEALETEYAKLQETVRLNDVHRLTRKYRITSVIEQAAILSEALRKSNKSEKECCDILKACVAQLKAIKEEDNQLTQNSSYMDSRKLPSTLGERLAPVGSESDASSLVPSDNLSQSSISVKSYPYNTLPTSFKWSQLHLETVMRSNSSEDTTTVKTLKPRNISRMSPVKKISAYPDPPPNFILNKDKAAEYDKDGSLRYIPKASSRSSSFERKIEEYFSTENDGIDTDDYASKEANSRSSSTNILYKIRREELARGGQPSVKLMAKAFDSIQTSVIRAPKRSLFNMRKSRSVETNDASRSNESIIKNALPTGSAIPVSVTVLGRNTSLSHIEDIMASQSPYGNIPAMRGGRNPFKNMGTKLVERVRRSLSRSSSKRNVQGESDVENAARENFSENTKTGIKTVTQVNVRCDKEGKDSKKEVENKVQEVPLSGKKVKVKKKVKKSATTNLTEILRKT